MVVFKIFEKSGESETDVERSSNNEYFTHLPQRAESNFQEALEMPNIV
jgi:hypothetical protein